MQLIVPCTSTKRYPIRHQLRDVPAGSVKERLSAWHGMLIRRPWMPDPPPLYPVEDLYCGPSWSMVHKLRAVLQAKTGAPVGLNVASAGYGLVGAYSPLQQSYSATFAAGLADSVGSRSDCRAWWNALSLGRVAPLTGGSHSVAELEDRSQDQPILCVLSPAYFNAMVDDLHLAIECREAGEIMIVTSKAAIMHPDVEPYVVRADSSMRSALRTNNVLLNHAAALHLATHLDLSRGLDLDV